VNEFFSMYQILQTALGPGVYSASNINENQKWSEARSLRRTETLPPSVG
jgi:hypothetical protein